VAGGGQATVSAGLLVAVTRLSGEGERGGVASASLVRLAGGQQGFPGAVERLGFPAAAAGRLEQGERLPVVFGRLRMLALAVADLAEPSQRLRLQITVPGLAGEGERGGVAGAGLVRLAGSE
jgi:hypothetical protein